MVIRVRRALVLLLLVALSSGALARQKVEVGSVSNGDWTLYLSLTADGQVRMHITETGGATVVFSPKQWGDFVRLYGNAVSKTSRLSPGEKWKAGTMRAGPGEVWVTATRYSDTPGVTLMVFEGQKHSAASLRYDDCRKFNALIEKVNARL